MAISQFTLYTSADSGSPILNANTGSLLTVLDAILVNGYGSKPAAGWTKPFANSDNMGCYKQPSGSLCTLYINDNGTPSGYTREAWATGWETLTAMGQYVGTGSGQFPTVVPFQGAIGSSGSVIFRKGNTGADWGAGGTWPRFWLCYADAWTFYFFSQTGDSISLYRSFWFGDIFSLYGSADTNKCMIHGNEKQNTATGGTTNGLYEDQMSGITQTIPSCLFIQRGWGGRGRSINGGKLAMPPLSAASNTMVSTNVGLNDSDRTFYLYPLYFSEPLLVSARGRFRGMYGLYAPITHISDGQIIKGGNDYAGKTFQVVKQGPNFGMWAIEISPTVETN